MTLAERERNEEWVCLFYERDVVVSNPRSFVASFQASGPSGTSLPQEMCWSPHAISWKWTFSLRDRQSSAIVLFVSRYRLACWMTETTHVEETLVDDGTTA